MAKKNELQLCYVLKVGYKSNGEGLFEFLFTKDPSSIDTEECGWEESPANGNANSPPAKHIDLILTLQSKKIDLTCLHELNDRAYMDGYYTVHCLAYENTDSDNHDPLYDETVLLVFHFGMTPDEVKDRFLSRDIILKETKIENSSLNEEAEEQSVSEEEEEDEDEF